MIGDPGPKERQCLARLQEWEAGLEFEAKWGGVEWPLSAQPKLQPGFYDPKTMSRTVAKRLGLI